MVKVIEIYGKKEGWTREEFFDYQENGHMKTVAAVPEFIANIRGTYQNNLYLPEELSVQSDRSAFADFVTKDKLVELFLESNEAAYTAFHGENYLAVVRPDEEKFSDAANGWSTILTEEICFDTGREAHAKWFLFFRCADGSAKVTDADVRETLIAAAKDAGAQKFAINKKSAGPVLDNHKDCDGMLELWFDGTADMEKAVNTGVFEAVMREKLMTDSKNLKMYCAEEVFVQPYAE